MQTCFFHLSKSSPPEEAIAESRRPSTNYGKKGEKVSAR